MLAATNLTGQHLRAARALLNLSAQEVAKRTSLGIATILRAEKHDGATKLTTTNAERLISTFSLLGVELTYENDGGIGARLKP